MTEEEKLKIADSFFKLLKENNEPMVIKNDDFLIAVYPTATSFLVQVYDLSKHD